MTERTLVVWFPDWPVTAWRLSQATNQDTPVAVVSANLVSSCSGQARAEGVRVGMRHREAQSRCPDLEVVAAEAARDHREFAPVIDRLERVAPGVQVIEPGRCALRARGPARFYGGEEAAAIKLLRSVAELGFTGGRAGIADGLFTAEQAAYAAEPILVVAAGAAAEFLAPLPVAKLGDAELASLLPRLGVRRLGEFVALDPELVAARFGARGARLHALASGDDGRAVQPRQPPPDLDRELAFETPVERAEQIAFSIRTTAEGFVAALTEARLVCTELQVVLTGECGDRSERVWLHPAAFDPAAVVDRVRWQCESAAGRQLRSGVTRVQLSAIAVDEIANHEPGLFGSGPDERVHHALSRVQSMLGHTGVLTPRITGGRWLTDRQSLVPWGDRSTGTQPRERPWPGSLPAPLPATVFSRLRPVDVLDQRGEKVVVDSRGNPSASPVALVVEGERQVVGWAGPWPVAERPWDETRRRQGCRFQMVDDAGQAWLLLLDEQACWWAEARYD